MFVPEIAVVPSVNADQFVPSHNAIFLTVMPLVVSKTPLTYRLPLVSVSIADTVPSTPEPIGDHVLPFHMAILFAETPPISENAPPAYKSPLAATF